MASDYPTAIDPALPEIVNRFDALTPDVLQHVIDMLEAVQTGLGNRPGDLTALAGGQDLGSVASALFQLSRVQTGHFGPSTITSEEDLDAVKVDFDNRFSIPPFVFIQCQQPLSVTQVPRLTPRNVRTGDFQIATVRWSLTSTYSYSLEFDWLAIEPPFGLEATA